MSDRFSHARAALRPVTIVVLVGASILLLAACGGGGTPSATSAASTEASREQKFKQLAKCLREHGINVSTPTGKGPVRIQGTSGGNIAPQTMEAAQSACRKYAPGENQNLTPQQRVERQEAVRKFAKCMREHGIKVETQTSGDAIRIGIHAAPGQGGPNPESPAFQAAQKACQSYLPFKGGPPRGGPGSGPSTNRSGGPGQGSGPSSGFAIGG